MIKNTNSQISTQLFKQQVNSYIGKFEQKLQGFINYQDNLITTQVQRMKQIVRQNQNKIIEQKVAIDDLADKIASVQVRTESKIIMLTKQLQNFKSYYDQCYQYTITRVNQIANKTTQFSQQINKQSQSNSMLPVIQYIKYTHDLLNNIIKTCSMRTIDMKYQLDEQLYQLQLQISKFTNYVQEIEKNVDQMKFVKFGNASLQDSLTDFKKIFESKNQPNMTDSQQFGKRILSNYDQKFKQIIKRINTQSIQIQMLKTLMNNENNQNQQKDLKRQKQFIQYQQTLKQLEKSSIQQKALYEKNISKKEEILKKRQQKILQLQDSLHVFQEKQIKTQHQFSELKLYNIQLSKEVKRLNQQLKSRNKQSITSDKSNKNLKQVKKQGLQQKLLILQVQYENLLEKYKAQQDIIKRFQSNPNKFKIQPQISNKMATSSRLVKQFNPRTNVNMNMQQQILLKSQNRSKSKTKIRDNSNTKTLNRNRTPTKLNTKMNQDINQFEKAKLILQIDRLTKNNIQLTKINKQLQDQITYLINTKSKQNKQEQEYLDKVEQQIYKNSVQIQRLQSVNMKLSRRNAQLEAQNQKLQNQLNNQIQKFQQKSKNFKNVIFQLQKQNEVLKLKKQQFYDQFNQNKSYISAKRGLAVVSPSSSVKKINANLPQNKQLKINKPVQKKARKLNNFLLQLQSAIIATGLLTPICIQVDKNGYIRQKKTGNYLVDQNNNPIYLSQAELKAAIENDLVVL